MNKIKQKLLNIGAVLGIALAVFAVTFMVAAWTGPTQTPPDGNVPAPIAAQSDEPQTVSGSGSLGIDQLFRTTEDTHLATDSGKVGIGTKSPDYELEVNGDIKADTLYAGSDISLKKNIKPIENPLSKIQRTEGVFFNWKKDGKESFGVIAQDIEHVFPEAVTEKDGIKSVNYGILVAPLIEAMKEQQKIIEEQDKRIEALEIQFNSGSE